MFHSKRNDLNRQLRQSSLNDCSTAWTRYNPLMVDKYIPRGFRGINPENHDRTPVWDNGKDWNTPCVKEGGWIRIYPLTRVKSDNNGTDYAPSSLSESSRIVEREIKSTVVCIQK